MNVLTRFSVCFRITSYNVCYTKLLRDTNIQPMIDLFPKWNVKEADKKWCAAFVYYCCIEAGFKIPYSPKECVSCSLAGCGGWEDFAINDKRMEYYFGNDTTFVPEAGDIVLYVV